MSSLMASRRFAPLFWCQFFSAFNDNFLKNALVFLVLFGAMGTGHEALITLAGAVFILPFFLLSGLGGQLADRYDKARVAQRLKLAEIGAAGVAVAGFFMQSVPVLFVALFLFGVIAALFGPIKYGILPDHLAKGELPAGNALVESATFLAILLGTIAGSIALKAHGDVLFALLIMGFAGLCWGASLLIPRTGEAAPMLRVEANVLRSTVGLLRDLAADRRLLWGALVVSWFWVVGAVALSLLGPLVKDTLGGNENVVTTCLAIFAIGIALGSGLAAWIAKGRIVLRPTVVAATLLCLFCLDLAWAISGGVAASSLGPAEVLGTAPGWHAMLDLGGLAVAGGLFVVPPFAAVQVWAGADRRARVVAGVNVLNAGAMVVASLVLGVLQEAGLSVPSLFVTLGAGCALVALIVARTVPPAGAGTDVDAAAPAIASR